MTKPPKVVVEEYSERKLGYFGELGAGANARVMFLQTAITRDELDNITLIENIPGSEKWDVRDLFQRDVDKARVQESIVPWLQDKSTVKFFNPLTLILLPLDDSREHVDKDVTPVIEDTVSEPDHPYTVFRRTGYFEFHKHHEVPAYSQLRWNRNALRIVAIDGQHRLSALKLWKTASAEASAELSHWHIPVVILGVFRSDPNVPTANLLDVVRKIFVYINTRAEEVNEARRILLDDESVCAVCTQEVVQAAHANDCRSIDERVRTELPLLFFDWRGGVVWRGGQAIPQHAPGAVKSIEELHGWLTNYVLGEDQSDSQRIVLNVDDMVPPLDSVTAGRGLTYEDAARIRTRFNEIVAPGLRRLLQEFAPYKDYIDKCRTMESRALGESILAEHAFMKLRFGTHRAPEEMMEDVNRKYEALVEELTTYQQDFAELLGRDIGMRGVMFAFGALKDDYDEWVGATSGYCEFAEWFVGGLNGVYGDGWFESHADLPAAKRKALTHVAYDPSGSIINYKISDVPKGLGALLVLLVAQQNGTGTDRMAELWDKYGEAGLRTIIRTGCRKEVKAALQDTFEGTASQLKAEINRKTEYATKRVMAHLQQLFGVADDAA